jgi:hypothetical protein
MILERVGGRVEVSDAPLGGARFAVAVPRRGPAFQAGNQRGARQ